MTPPDSKLMLRIPAGTAISFDSSFAALDSADRRGLTPVKTKKGETFATIAKRHGLQIRQLQWYNRTLGAKKGRLPVGQTVYIPSPSVVEAAFDVPDPAIERYGSSSSSSRSGRVTHVVRRGETLGGIAKRYGTSVSALTRLNGLKRSVIYPGQTIIVRGSSPARSSSSSAKKSSSKTSSSKASTRQEVDGQEVDGEEVLLKEVDRQEVHVEPHHFRPICQREDQRQASFAQDGPDEGEHEKAGYLSSRPGDSVTR